MPAPATTGQLRYSIQDMQIGDYIVCNYTRSTGAFVLNDQAGGEIPLTGVAPGASASYFYFIKVYKGLLISDRVIAHSASWDTFNSNKWIQRLPVVFSGIAGIIRSLTGGVTYADANGNKSTTDQGFGGWPTNNEWDKYIVNFPADKIQAGKTLDDVFHWNGVWSWCQDTPINGLKGDGSSSQRIIRGYSTLKQLDKAISNWINTIAGFRPVFEYKEV